MIKRIIAVAVAVLVLLIIGTAVFALHSETVLRWTVAQALAHYPGELSVGEVKGTLSGPVTLHEVAVHTSALDASIQTLNMDWHVLALLTKHVNITQLDLSGVNVKLTRSSSHKPFKLARPKPPRLPVAINVQQLTVRALQVNAPSLSQPLKIKQAALAAKLDNRAWSVSHLQVSGSEVQVEGHGKWQFQLGEQVNAQLKWQLSLPQLPAFSGQASVTGDEQTLRLRGSLRAPFQLKLAGQVHEPFSAPSWDGTLNFNGLDPRRLRKHWPELVAQGNVRVQGSPQATVLTGNLDAREPTYGVWHSRMDLRLAGRTLEIRKLQLARNHSATRLDLAGQVLYKNGHVEPDVHGEWQELPLPLTGKPWFTSPNGKLNLSAQAQRVSLSLDGTLAHGGQFTAQGEANMSTPHNWTLNASARKFQLALTNFNHGKPLPPMDLKFRGHGDEAAIVVDQFNAALLNGHIQVHGRIAPTADQTWQFQVAAQHINPAALYPQFPGALDFNTKLSGQLAPSASWAVQLTRLNGELHNVPVQASGDLNHRTGLWQFRKLAVKSGKNHVRLDGQYGQRTQITWTLDAPDLASLSPDIRGSMSSAGHADFSGNLPVVAFTLKGQNLQYADNSLGKLDLQVNLAGTSPESRANLHVAGVQIGKLKIATADGEASGSPANHTLKFTLDSPYGRTQIAGSGHYANRVWQGDLTDVTLSARGAGQWKNSTAWQPRIAASHFSLPQACVTQASASTCLQAHWQPGHWQADALITAVPATDLQALLPQGLAYDGSFGGHLHVQEADGQRTLALDANLSPGAIRSIVNHHQTTLLAYTSGNLKLRSDEHATTGQLSWALADGGYLNIDTHISHDKNLALTGSIHGEIHDFQLIPALVPAVGSAKGKLAINLRLSGTPSTPLFDGNTSLTDGELGIPRYGLHMTGISLDLKGNGDHLALEGSAHSGNGSIHWESSVTRSANHWQAQGKLTGKNFEIADTPEVQVDVSPALDLKVNNYDISLNGDVTIPHAKIQPRDLSQTASVSPDQVIVGVSRPPPSKWRVHAKVRAIMGPDVRFDGFGLTGRIAGNVQAVDKPGQATTGDGALEIVGGKFAAYGQKLDIERGRLLFSGPIANPALDIRAIRPPARTVTAAPGTTEQKVGVLVRGPLRHPKISLFAQPPLPQSQMLSYLLTGQTGINQNSSPLIGLPPTATSDTTQIVGKQLLASELGAQIGLKDVSVQNVTLASGTSAQAVFLGKYLSPRLYISYGTVLGQSLNTLRIQYTLSTRWMLEAETGFASGADLIYSIER